MAANTKIVVFHFKGRGKQRSLFIGRTGSGPNDKSEFPWPVLERILPEFSVDQYREGEKGVIWMVLWLNHPDGLEEEVLLYVGPESYLFFDVYYPAERLRHSLMVATRAQVFGANAEEPSTQALAGKVDPEKVDRRVWD